MTTVTRAKSRRATVPKTEPKTWISVTEAVAMGVSNWTLKSLIKSKQLSVRKLPRSRPLVRRDEVEALIRDSTFERVQSE